MPLPFLVAGLGAAAAALGVGGHLSAKEINEKAQKLSEEAQDLYNSSKRSLENAQQETEKALLNLGNSKKKTLETSFEQFFRAYARIKDIKLKDSTGLDEISNFMIDEQEVIEIKEMADVYQASFSSGAAGAATGAVIALAASGSLPVVTGTLSVAGSALMAGEIGAAASLAGSALSFGAAMTPLAAIAAPVVLFTGISASLKADENLEKAQAMYAEAEAASEKMAISRTLCVAIADRSEMFNSLLVELDGMFAVCTSLLDGVTRKKMGFFGNKVIKSEDLTKDEKKLAAVTCSLAHAVKSVIDTPMLSADGSLSDEAERMYEDVKNGLPSLSKDVEEIKTRRYNAKPIATTSKSRTKGTTSVLGATRNVIAIIVGWFMSPFIQGIFGDSFALGLLAFGTTTLLIMDNDTESKIFKFVKHICGISLIGGFSIMVYSECMNIVYMNHYIIGSIVVGFISMIITLYCFPSNGGHIGNFKRTMIRIFGCVFFFAIAVLLYAILHKLLGISQTISGIITVVPYVFFAWISVSVAE